MPVKDSKTEELIKETALRIFFTEGKLHATTQDIADAAGVNRALLHYYFRSRDVLFDVVFREAKENMHCKMEAVFQQDISFREKIEHFIENFIETSIQYPYLEAFLITEIVRNPEKKSEFLEDPKHGNKSEKVAQLMQELQAEMDAGNMPKMQPEQYFMNLISLLAYPFLAKPLMEQIFNLEEDGWKKAMRERKKLLIDLIFPAGK